MRMSGDEKRHSEEAAGDVGGPGLAYQCFVQMDDLLDKLKLLHYEESFCRLLGFKPFSRYSANSTVSAEASSECHCLIGSWSWLTVGLLQMPSR